MDGATRCDRLMPKYRRQLGMCAFGLSRETPFPNEESFGARWVLTAGEDGAL